MARYHLSPQDGKPRVCSARIKCDYADANDGKGIEHYPNKAAAMEAHAVNMKKEHETFTKVSKKTKQSSAEMHPVTEPTQDPLFEGFDTVDNSMKEPATVAYDVMSRLLKDNTCMPVGWTEEEVVEKGNYGSENKIVVGSMEFADGSRIRVKYLPIRGFSEGREDIVPRNVTYTTSDAEYSYEFDHDYGITGGVPSMTTHGYTIGALGDYEDYYQAKNEGLEYEHYSFHQKKSGLNSFEMETKNTGETILSAFKGDKDEFDEWSDEKFSGPVDDKKFREQLDGMIDKDNPLHTKNEWWPESKRKFREFVNAMNESFMEFEDRLVEG